MRDMNKLEKIFAEKKTENGDVSYNTTGNNMIDLLFMADFFERHPNQAHIGDSEKEKLFAMYMRDPRFGQGRRELGRKLLKEAKVDPYWIIKCGRFDDLWHIPTTYNLSTLKLHLEQGNELAKKWCPRLGTKDNKIALALCDMWGLSKDEYRKLIKTDSTTEYKLSYAELKSDSNPLMKIFHEGNYEHPLVDKIEFDKVPSLAMLKYMKAFATRPDTSERFKQYMEQVKENKKKINTTTANVHNAYKTVKLVEDYNSDVEDIANTIGEKIVDQETDGLSLDCICILDTSASMGCQRYIDSCYAKAISVCHSLATHSNYARNQLISFSSNPRLMTIRGNTLKEQYQSMYTGDCSNTDLIKVMEILKKLDKFPQYLIILSDMEFDSGSARSKDDTMAYFKECGANTKIIWWNFKNRNRTTPEYDEYGNIYMSGYDLQSLLLLPGVMDMEEYINKIIEKYKNDIEYKQ